MNRRLLSVDDSSLLLDRLCPQESITHAPGDIACIEKSHDAWWSWTEGPFNLMGWNSRISDIKGEEFSPKVDHRDSSLLDGSLSWNGRSGHTISRLNEHDLQTVLFALESRSDGPSDFVDVANGRERPGSQAFRRENEFSDHNSLEAKLLQAVQVVCHGLVDGPVTIQDGIAALGMETMKLLLLGAEVYSLANGSVAQGFWFDSLWHHSLRAGYLARVIAEGEGADTETIRQACAAAVLHDFGILVLTCNLQDAYYEIRTRAQRETCPLAVMEKAMLGLCHGEIGGHLLRRWGVSGPIVEAVALHDEPFRSSTPGFTPLTAVYVANVLDGGGWAQDGDGVPAEQALEYLTVRGLVDHWPKWQMWLRQANPLHLFSE